MLKKIDIEKPDVFLKLVEENKNNYLYHDHPSDGLDLFTDEQIENYGWHAVTFEEIKYRDIAQFIEENCEGTFTFNDHPMGFNGYVIVDDIEQVRIEVKGYIINKIKSLDLSDLDDDQKEAVEFFDIKV